MGAPVSVSLPNNINIYDLVSHGVCENGKAKWLSLFGYEAVTYREAMRALVRLKDSGDMDKEEYDRFMRYTLSLMKGIKNDHDD